MYDTGTYDVLKRCRLYYYKRALYCYKRALHHLHTRPNTRAARRISPTGAEPAAQGAKQAEKKLEEHIVRLPPGAYCFRGESLGRVWLKGGLVGGGEMEERGGGYCFRGES